MTFDDEGAAAKFFQGRWIGLALDQDEVATAVLEAGIEKTIFEIFFVGEKEKPLGVHVESPERQAAGRKGEFREGPLPLLAGIGIELAQNAVGFVEGEEHGVSRAGLRVALSCRRL